MRSFIPAAVVALLCAAAVPVHAQSNFAFAVDRKENLYRVDLDNASAILVGVTGKFLEGLALSPNGRLFGTDTGGNLYQIDSTSGAATLVGNTGCGCDIEGLHFFGSMLVGVGLTTNPPAFLSINTQTGASTTLITAKSSTGPVRAMTSSDLNHALVAGAQGAFQHALYSVDLVTGDVTLIGIPNIGTTFLAAMDFNRAGTLYALDANGNEWTVDPCTAAVTLVGNTGSIFWLDMAASASHTKKSC